MSKLIINGLERLSGKVRVHGAKNSALPVLAACYAVSGECVIENCPALSDVAASLNILSALGCRAYMSGSTAVVDGSGGCEYTVPVELMHRMRSSICFLGALLARTGRAEISFPGGCELGPRPIDLHLKAFERMGVTVDDRGGRLSCRAERGLTGCSVPLSFPSVGATENVMIAASLAKGRTVISNAAREPEIVCLARFLNSCGARISGAGQSTIYVDGADKLHGCRHTVIPDRIEAMTFLAAGAITGGEVALEKACYEHLLPVLCSFEEMGCTIENGPELVLKAPERLHGVSVRTMPYPGFPTDCQAILMAAAGVADSTSVIVENIFDNRFRHVDELCRMGARISTEGRVAVINGVEKYRGAYVCPTDLRGDAALVTAALRAEGETVLTDTKFLDRGYQELEKSLSALGARVERTE